MKANELQIGDWVRLNFEKKPCFRVAQLLDDKLYVDEADFQFLQDWRYDDIEPLPITGKMLKRNDFKYDELDECYEWQQGDITHGFTADITLVKDDRGWLCNIFGPNCDTSFFLSFLFALKNTKNKTIDTIDVLPKM